MQQFFVLSWRVKCQKIRKAMDVHYVYNVHWVFCACLCKDTRYQHPACSWPVHEAPGRASELEWYEWSKAQCMSVWKILKHRKQGFYMFLLINKTSKPINKYVSYQSIRNAIGKPSSSSTHLVEEALSQRTCCPSSCLAFSCSGSWNRQSLYPLTLGPRQMCHGFVAPINFYQNVDPRLHQITRQGCDSKKKDQ